MAMMTVHREPFTASHKGAKGLIRLDACLAFASHSDDARGPWTVHRA